MTVGTPMAAGGSDGCPGQYNQLPIAVDDPLNEFDVNGNDVICVYGGKKNPMKPDYIDDKANGPSKVE